MKLFITGGGGMVGRNLCVLADQKRVKVLAPARNELDLMDYQATLAFLRAHKPDVVIHAAGLVGGIQANISAPYDFCFMNLNLGLNVIRAAQEAGVDNLINLGSSCMYPRDAQSPLQESLLLKGELEPTNEGYAVAKVAVSKLCEYISLQYGVNYRTLIPCNIYGCWDNFHPQRSHMIPAVIRKIHEAKSRAVPQVDIWGDGSARREFLFAADLAELILKASNCVDKLPQYMNVGLGKDFTINEYYQQIAEVIGYNGTFINDLSKPVGMRQKLVDISHQTMFGWTPPTSLSEGVANTYAYFLKKVI
ncbi:GDP-L-fucose synthase [Motiliproteus sp. MSK22-1]|uniref:GDP-L-fucose synthase family protein n=1 Tax=Motiliproteus sp. MSK22-1 TaxID=1897630 RepID=UPI0009755BA0|nr:GDP-L-fucose synthase [Motiliproteus sp. MSK22-1]OMH27016.1 GDP-fucose synthetase [Motiliproteus sp. MSK22-1]